ncbi:MAG: UbiA family prenyltransferase, partial [candidate division WOR-3 bacterium]
AVGLAFAEQAALWRIILAFVPLFLAYGFGQALTDCFQTDTDSISSPYRPLVQGLVSRGRVLAVSLSGLVAGVLIMGLLNPVALIFTGLAVVGLLTYTPFKRRWWGGPPWNSWIVALLPVIGRLTDRGYNPAMFFRVGDASALAFLLAVLAVFFGYANFVVMGYFKDISADRQTGYRTFPVVFGWKANAVYSDVLAVLVALLAGAAVALGQPLSLPAAIVFAAAVTVNVIAQAGIHRTRDEARSHGPIANVVRAFILYCLAISLSMRQEWLIPAVMFYGLFELTLRVRPEKAQV